MDAKTVIGARLREARERGGITIDDIASSTRINVKFLKEIEQGIAPAVPVIYLRAFIKAFAEYVELNPAELLNEYFALETPPPPAPSQQEPLAQHVTTPEIAPVAPEGQSSAQRQVKVLFVIIVAIVGALALLIYILRDERADKPAQELSFTEIMKERDAKPSPGVARSDSEAAHLSATTKTVLGDTLRLEAVASESVWVHIVIDNVITKEYILTPKHRLVWIGKNTFVLSVGNASALSLTLNGIKLDRLGKPNLPAKDILLSRETFKQFQKDAPKKEKG